MADMTVVGTLGRDPELRFTNGGKAIASCSLAETRKWKQGDEWKEETTWYNLSAWGELGENFAQSCTKGMRVIVQGRLEIRKYEKRDGEGTSVDVIANAIGCELRWATAQVERTVRTNAADSGGGNYTARVSGNRSGGNQGGNADSYADSYGYGDSEPF